MIEEFRKALKGNGQSLKWFYENHIKESTGLSYGGFCHQLNGYSPVSDEIPGMRVGVEDFRQKFGGRNDDLVTLLI